MRSLACRRIAVVGGTGFIGSHLTERLVAEGADVLAVARTAERLSRLATVRAGCVVAMADVCDGDAMIRTFRRFRPEIVFHLVSHPDATESFGQIAECVRINGSGLVNTLQAAVTAGAELFVYGDSAKNYGNLRPPFRADQPTDPVCSYAIVKSAGWQLCQLVSRITPLNAVALRPSFVYGPRQNRNVITYVQECLSAGRPVKLMGGDQTRDPLHIDDAVSAFVAAATEPAAWGHAIPVGGGEELTVRSLCETAVAAFGGSAPVIADAERPRLTEVWRSSCDNGDAERLMKWRPRVRFAEGVARIAQTVRAAAPLPIDTPVRSRADCYMYVDGAGVVYHLLDRRDGGDRRGTARGGRRADDVPALTGVARGVARPVGAPAAPAVAFSSFSS